MDKVTIIEAFGQKYFDGKPFPLCLSPLSPLKTINDVCEWLASNRDTVDDLLRSHKVNIV
jgi:hypothetical protein